jgi:hypothetical protein
VVGCSTSGNSVTKTAITAGFDAGAASVETMTGSGYAQFSTTMAGTDKMAGLTHAYAGVGFAGIDYAFYLTGAGAISIYEGGVDVANLGAYAANDVFRVENVAGTILYLQNEAVIYTSAHAPTLPLFFQTSIFAPTANITGVTFYP